MKQKTKVKTEIKIKAREGSRLTDNQAEIYAKHIFSIMKIRSINMVTAEEILKDAENENTPYHDWFNWDDSIAAEEFRINQARQLLGSIVEVVITHEEEEPVEVRTFVNVVDEEGNRGYVKKEYAVSKPKLWNQVIQQAISEVTAWKRRYKDYQELGKIHKAIIETSDELGI